MSFRALILVLAFMLSGIAHSSPVDVVPRDTVYSGDGTFFEPGLGACGNTNTASDFIVAVGHGIFDSFPGATANPNNNPICGRKLIATHGGRSVTVEVQDRCAGCAGAADLDFTEAGFEQLASLDVGRLKNVEWQFV
ncbi:barwin-like endoglucanase [Mycena belliarum]|uniref:Barwin-like endoglucanase n=1 Tax=Mycena belliarum TaxID=1033014 RepID=A0AAD6U8B9_9AGAR|nr:barwin-like endoglucanase [Mycena belliae]